MAATSTLPPLISPSAYAPHSIAQSSGTHPSHHQRSISLISTLSIPNAPPSFQYVHEASPYSSRASLTSSLPRLPKYSHSQSSIFPSFHDTAPVRSGYPTFNRAATRLIPMHEQVEPSALAAHTQQRTPRPVPSYPLDPLDSLPSPLLYSIPTHYDAHAAEERERAKLREKEREREQQRVKELILSARPSTLPPQPAASQSSRTPSYTALPNANASNGYVIPNGSQTQHVQPSTSSSSSSLTSSPSSSPPPPKSADPSVYLSIQDQLIQADAERREEEWSRALREHEEQERMREAQQQQQQQNKLRDHLERLALAQARIANERNQRGPLAYGGGAEQERVKEQEEERRKGEERLEQIRLPELHRLESDRMQQLLAQQAAERQAQAEQQQEKEQQEQEKRAEEERERERERVQQMVEQAQILEEEERKRIEQEMEQQRIQHTIEQAQVLEQEERKKIEQEQEQQRIKSLIEQAQLLEQEERARYEAEAEQQLVALRAKEEQLRIQHMIEQAQILEQEERARYEAEQAEQNRKAEEKKRALESQQQQQQQEQAKQELDYMSQIEQDRIAREKMREREEEERKAALLQAQEAEQEKSIKLAIEQEYVQEQLTELRIQLEQAIGYNKFEEEQNIRALQQEIESKTAKYAELRQARVDDVRQQLAEAKEYRYRTDAPPDTYIHISVHIALNREQAEKILKERGAIQELSPSSAMPAQTRALQQSQFSPSLLNTHDFQPYIELLALRTTKANVSPVVWQQMESRGEHDNVQIVHDSIYMSVARFDVDSVQVTSIDEQGIPLSYELILPHIIVRLEQLCLNQYLRPFLFRLYNKRLADTPVLYGELQSSIRSLAASYPDTHYLDNPNHVREDYHTYALRLDNTQIPLQQALEQPERGDDERRLLASDHVGDVRIEDANEYRAKTPVQLVEKISELRDKAAKAGLPLQLTPKNFSWLLQLQLYGSHWRAPKRPLCLLVSVLVPTPVEHVIRSFRAHYSSSAAHDSYPPCFIRYQQSYFKEVYRTEMVQAHEHPSYNQLTLELLPCLSHSISPSSSSPLDTPFLFVIWNAEYLGLDQLGSVPQRLNRNVSATKLPPPHPPTMLSPKHPHTNSRGSLRTPLSNNSNPSSPGGNMFNFAPLSPSQADQTIPIDSALSPLPSSSSSSSSSSSDNSILHIGSHVDLQRCALYGAVHASLKSLLKHSSTAPPARESNSRDSNKRGSSRESRRAAQVLLPIQPTSISMISYDYASHSQLLIKGVNNREFKDIQLRADNTPNLCITDIKMLAPSTSIFEVKEEQMKQQKKLEKLNRKLAKKQEEYEKHKEEWAILEQQHAQLIEERKIQLSDAMAEAHKRLMMLRQTLQAQNGTESQSDPSVSSVPV